MYFPINAENNNRNWHLFVTYFINCHACSPIDLWVIHLFLWYLCISPLVPLVPYFCAWYKQHNVRIIYTVVGLVCFVVVGYRHKHMGSDFFNDDDFTLSTFRSMVQMNPLRIMPLPKEKNIQHNRDISYSCSALDTNIWKYANISNLLIVYSIQLEMWLMYRQCYRSWFTVN